MKPLIRERTSDAEMGSDEGSPLVVSIYYFDRAAAGRAIELLNRIGGNFKGGLSVEPQLWSFDVLQLEEVAAQAVAKTATADLIIVAAGHECELPAEVKECLEEALMLRGREEAAVVALVDQHHLQIHSPLCDYMLQLCQATAVRFFSTETLPLDVCQLTPERIHERAEARSSVLDGIMHRRLPRFE